MSLATCPQCDRHVELESARCPFCETRFSLTRARGGLSAIALGVGLAACGGGDDAFDSSGLAYATPGTGTLSETGDATDSISSTTGSDSSSGEPQTESSESGTTEATEGSSGSTGLDTGTSSAGTDSGGQEYAGAAPPDDHK